MHPNQTNQTKPKELKTAHIHADLMAQYALDAKKHDNPWELWEYSTSRGWHPCTSHPSWFTDLTYRRKRRPFKIAGLFVPEPCQIALAVGQEYFVPNVDTAGSTRRIWVNDISDRCTLESNLVHLDQCSATVHAKALIEVSKNWWK